MSSRRRKLQKRVWVEEKFCQEMRTVVCSTQTWSHKGGSFIAWDWMRATQLFCGYFDQCGFLLAISFLAQQIFKFKESSLYWSLWILSEIPSSVHYWAENNTLQKNSKGNHFANIKAKSVFEFDSPTIFWQKCPDFKSKHPDSILPFGLLMQLSSKTLCTHSITCKFICSCIHLMSTFRCTCNLS